MNRDPLSDRPAPAPKIADRRVHIDPRSSMRFPATRPVSATAYAALFKEGELYGDDYRKAIWRSKINLSFLTHSNEDEFAHKSFEIAGCGAFLLAERSPGHLARFVEDEEAVFFSTFGELAAKIRRYLPDEPARRRRRPRPGTPRWLPRRPSGRPHPRAPHPHSACG
jgi:Glycosyl transferases group 1